MALLEIMMDLTRMRPRRSCHEDTPRPTCSTFPPRPPRPQTRTRPLRPRVYAEGQTIVMVTHDLRSALRGSRILYLRDGRIRGELDLGERRGPGGGRVGGGGNDPDNAVDANSADAPAAPDDAARTAALTAFLAEMGW